MTYYEKYLKYKTKYLGLKHLEKLRNAKDFSAIIKIQERKYNDALIKLQEAKPILKDLVDKQADANSNYYNDISNKSNKSILDNINKEVKKHKNKIKKLEKLVLKTNNDWKTSITKANDAEINAAQKDLSTSKSRLVTYEKKVDSNKKKLEKAIDAQINAESKLQKNLEFKQQSEEDLNLTVQTLNKVQNDNLSRLNTLPNPTFSTANNIQNNVQNNNEDNASN